MLDITDNNWHTYDTFTIPTTIIFFEPGRYIYIVSVYTGILSTQWPQQSAF